MKKNGTPLMVALRGQAIPLKIAITLNTGQNDQKLFKGTTKKCK
jgi:hypothetical protein